jgi:Leucine Rich repeat
MNAIRFQSVRLLSRFRQLAIISIISAICATLPLACAPNSSEAEARALAMVKQFDGAIARDPDEKGGSVGKVDLAGKPVSDGDVKVLLGLAGLHNLVLRETRFTDAGMAYLKSAGRLRVLDLDQTRISDAGLVHLGELTSLRGLYLARTEVTDTGLAALRPLQKLRELGLGGTDVTNAGLIHINGLTDLRVLDLRETQVTDAGLEHLKALSKLQRLWLSGTKVSSAGAKMLQLALPDVKILR